MKIFIPIVLAFFVTGCASLPQEQTRNTSPLKRTIIEIANREGVPPHIALGLISVESRFNPRAVGRAGEIGLVQIKYESARGIGYTGTRSQLFDPVTNITWGMRYLNHAARGRWDCFGVSSYQRGRASSHICTGYGLTLMNRAEKYRKEI